MTRTNRPIGSTWQHNNGIRWTVMSPTELKYAGDTKERPLHGVILPVDETFCNNEWHRIDFIAYYNEI